MKSILYTKLFLGFFVFCSLPALAQDARHEIKTGLGVADDHHLTSVQDKYIRDYDLQGGIEGGTWEGTGPSWTAYLEYAYHINHRWTIGASVGYGYASAVAVLSLEERMSSPHEHSFLHEAGGVSYEVFSNTRTHMGSRSYFLMPTAKYTWYGHNRFRLYSEVGLGARYYRLDAACNTQSFPDIHERRVKLSYQFSAVGIEVGGERVRFFTELGYGMQGVFNLGILVNL